MNHFNKRLTCPLTSIICGYGYISILAIFFYFQQFYENSTFFTWGIPVQFMGTTINDNNTYYGILALLFLHQLINNWVNDVVYPWIITCVQDPKSKNIVYSKHTSMLIINMFALYSELDMILIISGCMSQLTFFVMIILANMISVSIINWQYIKTKSDIQEILYENMLDIV